MAARGLKFYTEYELKNGTATEITYDSEYIDILKADDVDLTVFVGDTRLCTSVLNDNGQRNEGTKAADGIWDKVSKGETFINDNTKVAGKDYYVVYLPITDASNKVIGMAFAGTPRSDISSAKRNIILISVITAIILMVVFGGIGSIPGALLGGILLGIIENMTKAYLSTQLSDAIVFSVLIIVLLIKPTGLLGKKENVKV